MFTRSGLNRRAASVLRTLGLLAAGVLLMGAGTGCGGDNPSSLSVPMTWKSTSDFDTAGFAGTLPDSAIYVAPVTDKRTNKDQIGENKEEDLPVPIYASGEPAELVTNGLREYLKMAGLNVVDDRATADRIVTADLNRFWVTETGTYKGEVVATVYVKDKGGRVLWKGTGNGSVGKWGRSLNPENYQEIYSDAIIEVVESVLNQPGFHKALEKTSTPAAGTNGGGIRATPADEGAEPAVGEDPPPAPRAAPVPPPAAVDEASDDPADTDATEIDAAEVGGAAIDAADVGGTDIDEADIGGRDIDAADIGEPADEEPGAALSDDEDEPSASVVDEAAEAAEEVAEDISEAADDAKDDLNK